MTTNVNDGNKFDVWNGNYKHETDPQWVEAEKRI
jgi:hypothetical protein